jgi:5-methylcytosine-specific restriction endonuclease McrA
MSELSTKQLYLRAYYQRNKDKVSRRSAARYEANKDEIRLKRADHYRRNSAIVLSTHKERRAALKLEMLCHYGPGGQARCWLCAETRLGALTIDHVVPCGGGRHRQVPHIYIWLRRNNKPASFRTLCMNCNWLEFLRLKPSTNGNRKSLESARTDARLKAKFFDQLGNSCSCGEGRLAILTAHHIDHNGAEHRRAISRGKGGSKFYRAVLATGEFTGLETRCFSCNAAEEFD